MTLDPIDRRLLRLVQENARMTHAELGARVNLSISAVAERLRKLSERGAIRAWEARLDPHALGLALLSFVHVLLERPDHSPPFLAWVADAPEVQECHHVTGDWSYLLKIRTRDTRHLENLITEGVKALPGVVRTHTVIALSSPKEGSALDCGAAS